MCLLCVMVSDYTELSTRKMTKLKNSKYQHVIIIGNGFDLDLGLPTMYSDFINSPHFNKLLIAENQLATHLNSVHGLQKWIDIENELKKFSMSTKHPNNYLKEYKSLSNELLNYLDSIDYDSISTESEAYSLIKNIINKKSVLIIDFNYTSTLDEIMTKITKYQSHLKAGIEHVKIHGSVANKEIIFGVEDSAKIKKEHIFLKKSASKMFKPIDFSFAIERCDNLWVFGHSLGETDHMYFADFFTKIVQKSVNAVKQRISLYHYDEQNYYSLLSEVDALTKHHLKDFKQRCDFKMIEIKKKV